MKEPDMEVIRFNEPDIIVASGGYKRSAILSGWGDNIDDNAKMTFTGQNEVSYDWRTLHSQALEEMLSGLTFIRDNDFIPLYSLAMDENLSDKWNGRYEKGEDGNWHWKGRQ